MTVVSVAVTTHKGAVRSSNEDAFLVGGLLAAGVDIDPTALVPAGNQVLFAAAIDGMGGHAGGEIASRLIAECLAKRPPADTTESAIVAALENANRDVYDAMLGRPDRAGMGATVAGVVLVDNAAAAFNVGDARVYVSTGGYAALVTQDHRVGDSNVVTQSLGGALVYRPVTPYWAPVEPAELIRLLICTDGLSDTLEFSEIQGHLRRESPMESVSALRSAALDAGASDNVTALVVDVVMKPTGVGAELQLGKGND